jgi:phosphate transport system substrate-binding protein
MRKLVTLAVVGTLTLAGAALPGALHAQRDQIRVVGSSTVYPYTAKVAELFGRTGGFKTPVVESTGTGGGFKLFCGGIGPSHPDVTGASRAIKASEVADCAAHGVKDITEIMIGFDGLTIANSRRSPRFRLTARQVYLALAKTVPNAIGGTRANPYTNWSQIDKALPNMKIEVYGPPPTSGTRDAFVELVMQPGCKTWPWLADLEKSNKPEWERICNTMREDGPYIEAGENDNLIVQKLEANPNAVGVFGYSFLEENRDQLQGSFVNGVEPTFDTIADKSYPVSRPLFIYVKKAHVGVIPGIKEFVAEFTSNKAIGDEGYLTEIGLTPMPAAQRTQVQQAASSMASNVKAGR